MTDERRPVPRHPGGIASRPWVDVELPAGPLADVRPATESPDDVLRWLVSLDEPGSEERRAVTLTKIIDRARAALPSSVLEQVLEDERVEVLAAVYGGRDLPEPARAELFDRVALAAHLLDEEVFCVGYGATRLPAEPCPHGGKLRVKYDGGRLPVLCDTCRLILGYLPSRPPAQAPPSTRERRLVDRVVELDGELGAELMAVLSELRGDA